MNDFWLLKRRGKCLKVNALIGSVMIIFNNILRFYVYFLSLLQKYSTIEQQQHPSTSDHSQGDKRHETDAQAQLPGSRQEIPRVQWYCKICVFLSCCNWLTRHGQPGIAFKTKMSNSAISRNFMVTVVGIIKVYEMALHARINSYKTKPIKKSASLQQRQLLNICNKTAII